MKITCSCGAEIFGGPQAAAHKAHAMAEADWARLWDAVEAALKANGPVEPAAAALREAARARPLHECAGCGRLWIADATGRLVVYAPEDGGERGLFAR